MQRYKVYSGVNYANVYLVIAEDTYPEVVPLNLRYLFGDMALIKAAIRPSFLPFGSSGRSRIVSTVAQRGYCFYRWPGKVLGESISE